MTTGVYPAAPAAGAYQSTLQVFTAPTTESGRTASSDSGTTFTEDLLFDTVGNAIEFTPDVTVPFVDGDSFTVVHKQTALAIVGAGNLLTDFAQLDVPDWVIYGLVTDDGLAAGVGPDGTLQARKFHIPASSGTDANVVYNFGNATITGQWVASVWLRGVVGGEQVYLHVFNVGGSGTSKRCTLTTEWQQFQVVAPYTAFVDNAYVEIGYDGSFGALTAISACDIEAAYGQLEPGISATDSNSAGTSAVTFNAPVLYNGIEYATLVLNNVGASLTFAWSADEGLWIVTQCYEPTVIVAGVGTVTLPRRAKQYVKGDSTVAAVTINYPAAPLAGDIVIFKDSSGNAATNNYTLAGNGKTFDGSSSIAVAVAYVSYSTVYDGVEWGIT